MSLKNFKKEYEREKNPAKARVLSGFFKTGEGEYGEGDVFFGIVVPRQREMVKKYYDLKLSDLEELLNSRIHEYRLSALFILIKKFEKGNKEEQEKIYKFYLENTKNINNWDLVDLSTPNIIGAYLLKKDKSILYKLVRSNNLWERRISILATFSFIRNNEFADTLKIAELLLNDKEDLIHKAVGWMLREIGKRNEKILIDFLKVYYKKMPRTMLRYAIEKFPESVRQQYLKSKI